MSKKIFKYVLPVMNRHSLELPKGSIILSVTEQHEQIVLYAMVDDEEKIKINHVIRLLGTGHPLPKDIGLFKFLGTVKLADGSLMFHVFIQEEE